MYVNKQSSVGAKKLQEAQYTSLLVLCLTLSQYGATPLWYMDRFRMRENPEAMKIKQLLLSNGAKSEPVCQCVYSYTNCQSRTCINHCLVLRMLYTCTCTVCIRDITRTVHAIKLLLPRPFPLISGEIPAVLYLCACVYSIHTMSKQLRICD